MCGITGILSIAGPLLTDIELETFNNSLEHRGPDGKGTWINSEGYLGLGHRRLAIVDLSEKGSQPIHYNNRYHLTFNGEIYNYIELRGELQELGYSFHSDSDTEVLLIAYAKWGDQCLTKLNGMWAFAIWDSFEEELTICVDRFAVKSCVYTCDDSYFAFASEVKAFLHLHRFKLEMNENEIYRRLFVKEQDTIDTVVKNVQRIPAGHLLKVSRNRRPRLVRWWNTLKYAQEFTDFSGNREEKLRELLESSVHLRMRTDKPFGIPISGGMDSSSILMMVNRLIHNNEHSNQDVTTFHMAKKGPKSELAAVEVLNKITGTTLQKIDESDRMTYDMMSKLLYNNENIGVTSEGPYRIYKLMRENGVVVSLDGHGADELIAGYPFYAPAAMKDALSGIPEPFRVLDISQVWHRIAKSSASVSLWERIQNSRKFIGKFVDPHTRNFRSVPSHSYEISRQIRPRFSLLEQDKYLFGPMADNLNYKLYDEFQFGFLQKILRSFDYASMANGVEARTPFLDWRLVCFLFSLPSNVKMGRGVNKLLLRRSMRKILPKEVNNNPVKTGFITSGSNYYLNPEILEWIGDSLDSKSGILPNIVDVEKAKSCFNQYRNNKLSYNDGIQLYQVAQVVELESMYYSIKQSVKINNNR